MAGTREGGKKAAKTIEMRYGKDFYEEIGHEGGKSQGKQNNPGNFANRPTSEVRKIASKGGKH